MFRSFRIAALIAGIALTMTSLQAHALSLQESSARLQAYLSAMEPFGFSGTVLVAVGDSIVFLNAYGFADDSANIAVTTETAFDIGSLTKQFTATAILLLESQGKLSLSDSLKEYFPNVPADKSVITIHQLLTHTSGLSRTSDPPPDNLSTVQIAGSILAARLRFEPGQRFGYSNSGYLVLAAIVELASQSKFETFLKDQLFRRAKLNSTGFYADSYWPNSSVAHGYVEYLDQGSPLRWKKATNLGSGGIISTATDLFTWMRALRSGAILPAASTEKLFKGFVDSDEDNTLYGYGWYHSTSGRQTNLVWHEGDFNGFNSLCRWYVDEDITIIFLCNRSLRYGVGHKVAMRNNLDRAWWGDSVRMPPITTPIPNPKQYAGDYVIDGDSKFVLMPYGDRLLIYPSGQAAVNLMCTSRSPDSLRSRLFALNETTVAMVETAASSDSIGLISQMGVDVYKFAGGFLIESLAALADSLGELKQINALGTVPYPFEDDLQQSFFHLVYPSDTAQLLLGWHSGAINDVTFFDNATQGILRLPRPGLQSLAISKSGALMTYDPFTRETMTLQPSTAAAGETNWIATSEDRQIKVIRK